MEQENIVLSQVIHNPGSVIQFKTERVKSPSGLESVIQVVEHPGAVVILAIDSDKKILLVNQYRHCVKQKLLELPAGKIELGESDLQKVAERELQEEVGYNAKNWISLGFVYPAPGFCSERQALFVAKDLYESKLPADDDEEIEVCSYAVEELEGLINLGKILDAKTINLYLLAKLKNLI